MRKIILSSLLSLCLCLLAGCSYVVVDSDILKDNPEQPLIDPNIWPVKMTISGLKEPCRVKYRPYYVYTHPTAIVTGQIPRGKKYPVLIDSGFPSFIWVSDKIILENNLPIYPIKGIPSTGFCHLPFLKLGKVTLRNPLCMYRQQHLELQVFGIPIWREKWIIVSLGIMKDFRYILLDGVQREVELSAEQSFAPIEPNNWSQYRFTIEEDSLMVDIPIEGEDVHIAFDTCCSYGLTVRSKLWAKLSERVKVRGARDYKKLSGLAGWIPCKKMLIPKLAVGNKVIKNAEVLVLPEDKHFKMSSHLGMKFFKNTVVVLDFERNLMWVKGHGR